MKVKKLTCGEGSLVQCFIAFDPLDILGTNAKDWLCFKNAGLLSFYLLGLSCSSTSVD